MKSIALPRSTALMGNYGPREEPVCILICGSKESKLTDLYIKLMDGETEERSLYISNEVNYNEWIQFGFEEFDNQYLTHYYIDDFDIPEYWITDAVRSGCSIGSGQVSVPVGNEFYYVFKGNLLLENIKLIATISLTSGSPSIQISSDGVTWEEAVNVAEIESGVEKTYWLTGTRELAAAYIKFIGPMSIEKVNFNMIRDIGDQADQMPRILPGQSRSIKITGSGSCKARANVEFIGR